MIAIGEIIREIRKNKKLSLKTLSEKTDLTIGHLSQIERNLVSPSLSSLEKITDALNISVSALFSEPNIKTQFIPKENRTKLHYPKGGSLEYLINNQNENMLGAYIIETDILEDIISSHEGTELFYILEGQFHFFVGAEEFFLEEGDALLFNAAVPHWAIGKLDSKMKVLVACTPPETLTNVF